MSGKAERARLKRLVGGIIRSQGNRFIKELLRELSVPIGATKEEFEKNLNEAIDNGELKLDQVQAWLTDVEGWGNQHAYLYHLPSELLVKFAKQPVRKMVDTKRLKKYWESPTALEFPAEHRLTSISHDGTVFRMVWQKGAIGWLPAPERTYQKEEDLDLYEYRAYRQNQERTVSRFEVHLKTGLCALLLAQPIKGEEHDKAMDDAKRAISMFVSLEEFEKCRLNVGELAKKMDHANRPTNKGKAPAVHAQQTKLTSSTSNVTFASNSADQPYWADSAIQDVRNAVRDGQLKAFQMGEGVFIFTGEDPSIGVQRRLRVQLYAKEQRIRLWARMEAKEVWEILSHISGYK